MRWLIHRDRQLGRRFDFLQNNACVDSQNTLNRTELISNEVMEFLPIFEHDLQEKIEITCDMMTL
jgi:hypothetical protein